MQSFYKFIHSDKVVRKKSSSGGAFTLVSDLILERGGVVYGCIMDDELHARHIRAADKENRDKMRGSKYIQSNLMDIFKQIKNDLEAEYWVLFTGTPCQVYAVAQYLNTFNVSRDNLILLEIICHGVGSSRFFNDYIKHLEEKFNGKAIDVNFRAKHYKGQKQDMEVRFDNGKQYNASSTKFDWFYSVYLHNLVLRPSCYVCPFAKCQRYADLSIADHWGYQDDESYSLIVSNSEQGDYVMGLITGEKIEKILESEVQQPQMHHPCSRPEDRDIFWDIYLKNGYLTVQRWFGNNTVKGKAMDMLARLAYKLHFMEFLKQIYKIMSDKIR